MPRGTFYATVTEHRGGKRYGREVARQARTLTAARRAVEQAVTERGWGPTGYVQAWSDREQRRTVIAERDATGWYSLNPLTGQRVALEA